MTKSVQLGDEDGPLRISDIPSRSATENQLYLAVQAMRRLARDADPEILQTERTTVNEIADLARLLVQRGKIDG